MKTALAYSRQLPVDFANQVDYLMQPLVTLVNIYAGQVALSQAFSPFSVFLLLSMVLLTLLLASGIS